MGSVKQAASITNAFYDCPPYHNASASASHPVLASALTSAMASTPAPAVSLTESPYSSGHSSVASGTLRQCRPAGGALTCPWEERFQKLSLLSH